MLLKDRIRYWVSSGTYAKNPRVITRWANRIFCREVPKTKWSLQAENDWLIAAQQLEVLKYNAEYSLSQFLIYGNKIPEYATDIYKLNTVFTDAAELPYVVRYHMDGYIDKPKLSLFQYFRQKLCKKCCGR